MLDLFGEVAITLRDVEMWLDRVIGYDGSPLRAGQYVRTRYVVESVRAAKIDGSFDQLLYDDEYRRLDVSFWERRIRLRAALEIDRYASARHRP